MSELLSGVNRLIPSFQNRVENTQEPAGKPEGSFIDVFGNMLDSVNSHHKEAAIAQEMLATGEAADLHQVMIAVEKAGIATDLLLEIRNRLMDGYQSLIKMPM